MLTIQADREVELESLTLDGVEIDVQLKDGTFILDTTHGPCHCAKFAISYNQCPEYELPEWNPVVEGWVHICVQFIRTWF